MSDKVQETPDNGQEPTNNKPTVPAVEPPSEPEADPNQPVDVKTLPANVQNLIKSLRDENANHRKAKTDAEAQAAKAEEDRLAKQQEWEQLATKRQERIAELESFETRYTELSTIVSAQVEAEVNDWPEDAKNLLPDESTDTLAFLKAVEKVRPVAAKLKDKEAPQNGNGRKPKPVGPVRENREVTPVVNVKQLF